MTGTELFADIGKKKTKAAAKIEAAVEPVTETAAPADDEVLAVVQEPAPAKKPDELQYLRNKADMLGVEYREDSDIATIRAAIEAKIGKAEEAPKVGKKSLAQALHEKHMRLVRLRISNMNPNKSNVPGEIFTVANKYIGTVRKFVPYRGYDNGYHLPYCMYQALKNRTYLRLTKVKGRDGKEEIRKELSPEFGFVELPPLTQEELKKLAADQSARGYGDD